MATGVSSWSQTAASNATADANANWAEGMAPSQVNDSARAIMASVAKFRDDLAGTLNSGGTSTAYTLSSNQGFASLAAMDQRSFAFHPSATCGANPTLAVDGLTAKPLLIDASNAVPQGALRGNVIVYVTYFNSGVGSGGTGGFIIHNGHSLIAPGMVQPCVLSSAPPGWLLCDGSAVSRTTYADLFANIGTNYGAGDGSTTFNVPNLKGKVPAGVDSAGTTLSGIASLGTSTGGGTVTLVSGNMPQQSFTPTGTIGGSASPGSFLENTGNSFSQNGGTGWSGQTITINGSSFSFTGNSTTIGNASPTGVSVAQPTLAMNYIIKT